MKKNKEEKTMNNCEIVELEHTYFTAEDSNYNPKKRDMALIYQKHDKYALQIKFKTQSIMMFSEAQFGTFEGEGYTQVAKMSYVKAVDFIKAQGCTLKKTECIEIYFGTEVRRYSVLGGYQEYWERN